MIGTYQFSIKKLAFLILLKIFFFNFVTEIPGCWSGFYEYVFVKLLQSLLYKLLNTLAAGNVKTLLTCGGEVLKSVQVVSPG